MIVIAWIEKLLRASSDVVAIVADRIANGLMPQDYARPFLVWTVISEVADASLSCVPSFDAMRVQFDCYSRDARQARSLLEAVRTAVETITSVTSVQQFYETETKLFRWSLDASFISDR